MSLALVQGYSSPEEDEDDVQQHDPNALTSSDDEENDDVSNTKPSLHFLPTPPPSSSLPSAFDAFSQVSAPPEFLNNCVQEPVVSDGRQRWQRRRNRKEKANLPAGVVVEAKAQIVGIRERVRSDVEGNLSRTSPLQPNCSISTTQGGKRVATATNPNAEDAAELLRMCLQCGIPKTYSNSRGMVCPVCGDRPPADPDKDPLKKKGSIIKDKEKSKRMKGQSSHATWKSETEMQLRQQFD